MPSNSDDDIFFEETSDDEECCDSPKISQEDGFYVCLNCGSVFSRVLDDSPRRAFTQSRSVKVMKEYIVQLVPVL